jgi:hypothetical protein
MGSGLRPGLAPAAVGRVLGPCSDAIATVNRTQDIEGIRVVMASLEVPRLQLEVRSLSLRRLVTLSRSAGPVTVTRRSRLVFDIERFYDIDVITFDINVVDTTSIVVTVTVAKKPRPPSSSSSISESKKLEHQV